MDKEELEKLVELLKKYKNSHYPVDTGTSEESDLNAVIYAVQYSLKIKEGTDG